jgi:hypothetical protein
MIKNVKIGSDPELFLEKNGKIVSAEGIIGGSKNDPKPFDKGFFMQEDNVMVEFNIPASVTKDEFVNNMNFAKSYIETYVNLKGFKLNYSQSNFMEKKFLKSDQALEFGCEPDSNVYLRKNNLPPESTTNLRCCGGHVHVGYNNPNQETSEHIIRALDITLGLDSVILDKDTERKKLYGKAGTFRFKDYGVEYRTLSNFWIANNNSISWVYNRVHYAIDMINNGNIIQISNKYEKDIIDIINNHKVEQSIELSLQIQKEILIKVKK